MMTVSSEILAIVQPVHQACDQWEFSKGAYVTNAERELIEKSTPIFQVSVNGCFLHIF